MWQRDFGLATMLYIPNVDLKPYIAFVSYSQYVWVCMVCVYFNKQSGSANHTGHVFTASVLLIKTAVCNRAKKNSSLIPLLLSSFFCYLSHPNLNYFLDAVFMVRL